MDVGLSADIVEFGLATKEYGANRKCRWFTVYLQGILRDDLVDASSSTPSAKSSAAPASPITSSQSSTPQAATSAPRTPSYTPSSSNSSSSNSNAGSSSSSSSNGTNSYSNPYANNSYEGYQPNPNNTYHYEYTNDSGQSTQQFNQPLSSVPENTTHVYKTNNGDVTQSNTKLNNGTSM